MPEVQPGEFGADACDVLVARSVEPVLAHAVFFVILVGESEHVVHGGDGLVERGIEDRHLGDAREDLLHGVDALEACGVVQRGDLAQRADLLLDVVVYEAAYGEELSAVCHAVSDGLHLVERGDHAVRGVGQGVEYQADTGRVVGNGLVEFEGLLAYGFVGEDAVGQADAFNETFCEQLARGVRHVDHLILDRRGAAVQYENNHGI